MIGVDSSVLVRYLVGQPPDQAERAIRFVDEQDELGVSVVALAECAHVLRTQYAIEQREIIDGLIELVQRENIRVVGAHSDLLVAMLVRARSMPGRPVPDAMIVAAMLGEDAVPIATFDRDLHRYGAATLEP